MFFQFLLAIITIKVKLGRDVFRVIGDRITLFLDYTEMGARFVFGDTLTVETFTFAFRGLSTVYYLAACVSVLYYYNIVQNVVFCLGLVMSCILDTTIVESVNAAANIFFGITESPLLLKPYLYVLTPSEIHAVAASGFGSVAGTVLGLYVSFGARADHLIIGSVINPLSTLYMSKILYPEDEASQTTRSTMRMPESDAYNALDALASGAMNAVQMVLGKSNGVIFVDVDFLTCIRMYFRDSRERDGFHFDRRGDKRDDRMVRRKNRCGRNYVGDDVLVRVDAGQFSFRGALEGVLRSRQFDSDENVDKRIGGVSETGCFEKRRQIIEKKRCDFDFCRIRLFESRHDRHNSIGVLLSRTVASGERG